MCDTWNFDDRWGASRDDLASRGWRYDAGDLEIGYGGYEVVSNEFERVIENVKTSAYENAIWNESANRNGKTMIWSAKNANRSLSPSLSQSQSQTSSSNANAKSEKSSMWM